MTLYDSNNDGSQEPPSPGRHSTRYCIDYPNTGWRILPNCRVMDVYNSKISIQELAGRKVRIANAFVEINKKNQPMALKDLTISILKFNDDGLVDKDDNLRRIREQLDGVANKEGDSIVTKEDVEAVKRCLRISGAISH